MRTAMYIPILSKGDIYNKLSYFSASQINVISGCKFKWAAKYLYNLPAKYKKSQMLDIGNFFHDEAKFASVEGKENRFNPGAMLDRMVKAVEETKDLTRDHFANIIGLYLKTYGALQFNNENTEINISGKIPNIGLKCIGYIDHIKNYDNEKCIIDLKIKGTVNKDTNKEYAYTFDEMIQQGLYSYMTKIPQTYLYIINIKKRNKNEKVDFIKIPKYFSEQEYRQVFDQVRMQVAEMMSGNYPPNRKYSWCQYNMCEYWNPCHEIWG